MSYVVAVLTQAPPAPPAAPAASEGADVFQWILAVGGPSGLAVLLTAFWSRRKISAEARKTGVDAAQVLSAASVALLEPMRQQMATLSEQLRLSHINVAEMEGKVRDSTLVVADLNKQIAGLQDSVNHLTEQLKMYRDLYGPLTQSDVHRDNTRRHRDDEVTQREERDRARRFRDGT